MRPSTTDDRAVGAPGVSLPGGTARAVVVVAAGSGTRLAQGRPKAFVEVAGRSILARSLEAVFASAVPTHVVVVAPAALVDEATAIVREVAGVAADHATVVVGGDSRQTSVAAGLAAVAPDVRTVLVHDCARPFTPTSQFDLVAETVEAGGHGVVPGLPVTDTIKKVPAGGAGRVVGTVDRSELVAVQTPQGFPRAELDAAYAEAATSSADGVAVEHTDDAALFAAAGHEVVVVPGDPLAFKITTSWDLRRAESLVAEGAAAAGSAGAGAGAAGRSAAERLRTGLGVDVHAFDAAEPMHLGLLHFPDEAGLAGHSDGDAVAHAVVDALLSAAGLGDIGSVFGTDDPRFAGAGGEVFLTAALERLTHAGFDVVNVAVQVIGNRPRLARRRLEMEARLIEVVGAPVSVSATTTDGLGATGRGEGVTAIATALVSVVEPRERTAPPRGPSRADGAETGAVDPTTQTDPTETDRSA
ncbi:2-C-methyl-D-erythritol 4-phosphate cytidylyltransferase [Frigoribacterium faeni]|uniref:2-C-methyl-D-erythritol 4-phosphate cytidylyltransferase n=1 Tax=Frigoribacterium faeni TaxID=145483 RepID=UPI00141BD160|nr:2-C-methyl-D-erythritol 4-phosphate cytidylyltransferase/2-C-methyl-D-erythritol 2,4-cyclodiphosphate synthase [Frigoribacterium faeni]